MTGADWKTSELPLRESRQIQGNILAGFNKDHQVFVFLAFPDQARARAWLGEVVHHLATTRQVVRFNQRYSLTRRLIQGGWQGLNLDQLHAVWVNLALTAPGIALLEPERARDLKQFAAFQDNPIQRASKLGDTGSSDPKHWVVGRPNQPIHALLTMAADWRGELAATVSKHRMLAARHGLTVVYQQFGDVLPEKMGLAGHEHFGFKDALSQPGVRNFDPPDPQDADHVLGQPGTDLIAPGEFLLGHPAEDGQTRACPAWMRDGSFLVWRRLSQDVPGWRRQLEQLSGTNPTTPESLGARFVGRWTNGASLDQSPDRAPGNTPTRAAINDFEFKHDAAGERTPLFAHIRKMYPRDHEREAQRHRILRRGVPFGKPFEPGSGPGFEAADERGLIFAAFMASIEEQFEFLQARYANTPDTPYPNGGADPVIGGDGQVMLRYEGMDYRLVFQRFVRTTGSVYAFMPSIAALRDLGRGPE